MATKKIKGTLDISESLVVSSSISVGGSDISTLYAPIAANGYAALDGTGKIDSSVLPAAVMEYKGTFADAATATPDLKDGTGSAGDVYIVTVAGSLHDFDPGAGTRNIDVAVGDWLIYNGSTWEKVLNSNVAVSAATVSYDDSTSVIGFTTVQGAIQALDARVDANDAKVSNVDTDLSYIAAPTQGTVVSSDGTDAVIPVADITNAGLLSAADKSKLDGIEAGADVTDTANVVSALSNNVLTGVTVAPTDRVLIQDADDNNLRTVTAQDIANLAPAGVSSLSGLSDVDPSLSPFDNHILIYDGITDNRFESVLHSLARLSDVDSNLAPTDGQVLVYNVNNLQFEASTVSIPSQASDLSDISISSPTGGQILAYDPAGAGQFTNITMQGEQSIEVVSSGGPVGVTVKLNIPLAANALGASDEPTSDLLAIYDSSATEQKKISVKNLTGRAVGDIVETEHTLPIGALPTSATPLTGLSFANDKVRSFEAQVIFEAATSGGSKPGCAEVYRIFGIQTVTAGGSPEWTLFSESLGDDCQITFDIDSSGQVTFAFASGSVLPTGNYTDESGNFRFRASTVSTAFGQSI